MVNRSAPDLFLVRFNLKSGLFRAKRGSLAPLDMALVIDRNSLKTSSFLSLTDCPLNGI
jgi:hypothetical protein